MMFSLLVSITFRPYLFGLIGWMSWILRLHCIVGRMTVLWVTRTRNCEGDETVSAPGYFSWEERREQECDETDAGDMMNTGTGESWCQHWNREN